MKKITKTLVTGLVLLASTTTAFAVGTRFDIKATMDSGVKIIYKDQVQKLVDVNGVTKDPIMYNGTTYIPIRSVGEMLNLKVDWNNTDRTVILSEKLNLDVSVENDSLEKIMETIYSQVDLELPKLSNTVVTDENVKYYLGIDKLNGAEALASEPMMGSIAHSVVLLRAKEGTDIEALKKDIKEKVDPRKWICVGVERDEVIVDNIGDVVIMVISDSVADQIHQGFLNLANEN